MGRELGARPSPAGFQEPAHPEPAAPDRTGLCSSWLKGRDKAPGTGGKGALPASGLQEEGKKSTGGREQEGQCRKHLISFIHPGGCRAGYRADEDTAFHFSGGFLPLPNPSSHLHSLQMNNRSTQRGCTL